MLKTYKWVFISKSKQQVSKKGISKTQPITPITPITDGKPRASTSQIERVAPEPSKTTKKYKKTKVNKRCDFLLLLLPTINIQIKF